MIQFRCHHCANDFHVPESMAGVQAACNRCGAVVTVPVVASGTQPGAYQQPHYQQAGYAQPSYPNASYHSPTYPQPGQQPQAYVQPGYGQPAYAQPVAPWTAPAEGNSVVVWLAVGAGVAGVLILLLFLFIHSRFSSSPETASISSTNSVASNSGTSTSPSGSGSSSSSTSAAPSLLPAPGTRKNTVGRGVKPAVPVGDTKSGRDPFDEKAGGSETSLEGFTSSATGSGSTKATEMDAANAASGTKAKAGASAKWDSEGSALRIPAGISDKVTFGPIGCPIVIVGRDVWQLSTNKMISTIEDDFDRFGVRTLSADGRYLAAMMRKSNGNKPEMRVWDTSTGKGLQTIKISEDSTFGFITFSRDKYLLVGSRKSEDLKVWDVESGEKTKTLSMRGREIDPNKLAFSHDGQFFAVVGSQQLNVMKTSTNKPVVTMSPPSSGEPDRVKAVAGKENKVVPDNLRSDLSATFVYAWVRGVAFSPDGQELAAISTHPAPRLLCWDNRGKIVHDALLSNLVARFGGENSFEWFPDRNAWLIDGQIYDRESKQVVLSTVAGFGHDHNVHILDQDRLYGRFAFNQAEVLEVPIPWNKIRASLTAMKEKGPAYLAPGKSVGLYIEFGNLRGDLQDTLERLRVAMAKRLDRNALKIAGGANERTYFRLRFGESAGEQLAIREQRSRFDIRGVDTGRTATSSAGQMVVELIVPGRAGAEGTANAESTVLWRETIRAGNARSFREEINDASVRKSMLEHVEQQIGALAFPYFIPESTDLASLPLYVE